MAAVRRKKQYAQEQRRDYVARFARSGLKQAEFCRRAKLHPMTFSLWRRKALPPSPTTTGFAEVEVSLPDSIAGEPAPAGAAVLYLRGDVRLEVPLNHPGAWTGLGLMLRAYHSRT